MNLLSIRLQNPALTPTQAAHFHDWGDPAGLTLVSEYGWAGSWWWCRGALRLQWTSAAGHNLLELWGANDQYSSSGDAGPVPSAARGGSGYLSFTSAGVAPIFASVALGSDLGVQLVTTGSTTRLSVVAAEAEVWGVDLTSTQVPLPGELQLDVLPAADSWGDSLPYTRRVGTEFAPVFTDGTNNFGIVYYNDDEDKRLAGTLTVTSDLAIGQTAGAWPAYGRLKEVRFTSVPPYIFTLAQSGTLFADCWRHDTLTLPAPPTPPDRGRVISGVSGIQTVYRGGRVWRRTGENSPWTVAFTPTEPHLTLAQGRRLDRVFVTDGPHTHAANFSLNWEADSLPYNLASLGAALGVPLADLLLDNVLGVPCAAWLDGDTLKTAGSGTEVQTVGSGSGFGTSAVWFDRWPLGQPLLLLGRDNGYWQSAGPTCDQAWTRVGEVVVPTWQSTCYHVSCTGQQALVGWNSGEVQVCWRPGRVSPWSEPLTVLAVSAAVAPYVLQLRRGPYEIGWLNADDSWSVYRSDALCKPWSPR